MTEHTHTHTHTHTHIHTYIHSILDLLPILVTTEQWVEFLEVYHRFSFVIYFIHSNTSSFKFQSIFCCHFQVLVASIMSDSLRSYGMQPSRLLCSWDFQGKNSRVGCHFLLQGIFLTQGLNPGFLYCRLILYHLSHQGCLNIFKDSAKFREELERLVAFHNPTLGTWTGY